MSGLTPRIMPGATSFCRYQNSSDYRWIMSISLVCVFSYFLSARVSLPYFHLSLLELSVTRPHTPFCLILCLNSTHIAQCPSYRPYQSLSLLSLALFIRSPSHSFTQLYLVNEPPLSLTLLHLIHSVPLSDSPISHSFPSL